MRRRWQIAILVGTALGAAAWWGTPWYARRLILRELDVAGWPQATIERVALGWGTATVHGFDLTGGGALSARRITATWDLATVTVSGARLRLPTLDATPLLPERTAPARGTSRWPVGNLTCDEIAIEVAGHQATLHAEVFRLHDDRLHLTVAGLVDATACAITGSVSLAGDADVQVSLQDLDLGRLGLGHQLTGRAAGELHLVRTQETLEIEGPCTGHDLSGELPGLGRVQVASATGRLRWADGLTGEFQFRDGRGETAGIAWTTPDLTLRLADQEFTGKGRFNVLGAALAVEATASRDLNALQATAASPDVDLGRLTAALAPWWTSPLVISGHSRVQATVTRQADGWHGQAALGLTGTRILDPTAAVSLDLSEASAEVSGAWADKLSGTAVLRVAHATVAAPGITVASIDGTLPWSLGRDPQLDGSLQLSDLTVHGLALPRLNAHVRGVDGRIGGAASLDLLGAGVGRIDGWYTLPGQHGEFAVVVPRFTLPAVTILRTAFPALGQREISGDLTADGTLVVDAGNLTPHIRVGINEGRISDSELKLSLTSLAATTTITGFSPLTTTGDAPVNFASCTIGTQTFGHGDARVTARLPAGIDVAQASIAWCGGRLLSPHLAIDLANRALSGEIGLQRIELGALLAATIPRYLTGNGLVSGIVPLRLTWPDWTFTFGTGALYADPPPGWLHLLDRTVLTSSIATGIAAVDQKIVDTVADLVFDDLRIDIVPETPLTAVARVKLTGHGRTGDPPLAVGGFAVNLRGLEKALANALFIQGWRPAPPATHDPNLDRFFAPGP